MVYFYNWKKEKKTLYRRKREEKKKNTSSLLSREAKASLTNTYSRSKEVRST